jgi:glycine/D-amino acid oxidase-like deaminating enzyme
LSLSIVIVGGGVFAMTAAFELLKRGWEVTVLEQGKLPNPLAASTDISKVVRMDYGADEFYLDLGLEALAGWREWNRLWPWPPYHETGFLLLSPEPMKPGSFEYESFHRVSARGYSLRRFDPALLARKHPAWNAKRWADGYFNPHAGWAESKKVVGKLAALAQTAGVRVVTGARVKGLMQSHNAVTGVITEDGTRWKADVTLVCGGTWTPKLLPWLQDRLWSVGQPVVHFQVEDLSAWQEPSFVTWAADISRTGWYGFPANDAGIVKIANHGPGVRLDPDAPREVDAATVERFRAFVAENLPGLAKAPVVETRLCLYSDTFDGDFLIDRDPDRWGLAVAAGGSGHAFKFAPLLGTLIANAVDRTEDPRLSRFRWRELGAHKTESARAS